MNLPCLALVAMACAAIQPNVVARLSLPSGIEVQIEEAPCDPGVALSEAGATSGKPCEAGKGVAFGVRGPLPKTMVKRIAVAVGNRTYELDSSGMYDAWGERPLSHPNIVRYLGGWCHDASNCQVRGVFSDGAASFAAEWRVVDGRQFRTVLTDCSDVVDLFLRNIDPPRFD